MSMFTTLKKTYNILRVLSIDVVLGALSGGIMAVKLLNVQMETAWWFVLAFAVWIIYTTDHLIDSNKLGSGASSERRLFYYKNFHVILIIETILIVITIIVSFLFLDNEIIIFGIGLGIFVFIYLLLIQIKGSGKTVWLQKEAIVAMVYTAGIWAGPVLYSLQNVSFLGITFIFTFFLIVWADILIIARFEIENDKHDEFTSLPIIIGEQKSVWLTNTLLLFSVLLFVKSATISDLTSPDMPS